MGKRPKSVIAYAKLLAKVQDVLALYPQECRNIHIDALEVYPKTVDGANWHLNGYRRSGDDHDWVECREKIMSDIQFLRECYDVADK